MPEFKHLIFDPTGFSASTFSPHLDLVESEGSSEISQTITDFLKKEEAGSGLDQIHNLILKNLPKETLIELSILFNRSLELGQVPKAWKIGRALARYRYTNK
ncbi:hypothetical protein BpHYR1_016358 [Brachionus plicatilis]|uniref:RNA-directed DNA polymerase from mobile element jockey-like n=1 Tax=Brachionus plicatilis TaxID=10195 RepID=A0A3M7PRF2_BRAPC|nr:hypothetical protein BpHYR1_016358 [Brachionus plicatilis]